MHMSRISTRSPIAARSFLAEQSVLRRVHQQNIPIDNSTPSSFHTRSGSARHCCVPGNNSTRQRQQHQQQHRCRCGHRPTYSMTRRTRNLAVFLWKTVGRPTRSDSKSVQISERRIRRRCMTNLASVCTKCKTVARWALLVGTKGASEAQIPQWAG